MFRPRIGTARIRVVAVLLRELDEVTLRCGHEREAVVLDVPKTAASRVVLAVHA